MITFKQFLAEAAMSKYSYDSIDDFIDFFEDDFTLAKPGGRLVVLSKKTERKNDIFKGKTAEQVAGICQKYFDNTVRVENWTQKGDKISRIYFSWEYNTPAKAEVLYTNSDLARFRSKEGKEEGQKVYKELHDLDRSTGKTGGGVGYMLNAFSNFDSLVGVFTEGPSKGSPFVAQNAYAGKDLEKGDIFYATVDTERGNCKYKGTTR